MTSETGEDESQPNILLCPGWEEDRIDIDIYKMEDMVTFFSRILKEKEKRKTEGRA